MSKEASNKRYRIELNENQLRVIYNALEEYFRIPLAQCEDTARRLAFRDDTELSDEEFNDRVRRSRRAAAQMEKACELATGRGIAQSKDEVIATDMWRVIKERVVLPELATSLHRVMQQSGEQPIKVEELDADIMRVGKYVFTADGSGGVRIREEEGNDGK